MSRQEREARRDKAMALEALAARKPGPQKVTTDGPSMLGADVLVLILCEACGDSLGAAWRTADGRLAVRLGDTRSYITTTDTQRIDVAHCGNVGQLSSSRIARTAEEVERGERKRPAKIRLHSAH